MDNRVKRVIAALGSGIIVAALAVPSTATSAAVIDPLLMHAQNELANCQLLANNSTGDMLIWATKCIEAQNAIIKLRTPTPQPSTSPSPSVIPSISPSPSPLPTITPSPLPMTNCMPIPSACGFPDATNTGTSGQLTIVQGDVTLSTPSMIYADRDVHGCISVQAKNVTIRNVKVTCSGWYAIAVNTGVPNVWDSPDANLIVENSEINLAGQLDGKGIAFDGYTARRVHFYGGADCAHFGENVTIIDSFCEIPTGGPASGPHYDGFQSDGGVNIIIRHNTIRVPYAQTSAILMSTNTSPIRDVTIVDNLVAGGGYSIYCGTGAGGPVLGTLVFTGNRIARTYFPNGGYWGPVVDCPASGWRWDG